MKRIELVIQNRTGLHARPAKVLVNLAKKFKSEISLQHGEKRANAKSMISVLTLGAISGSAITVEASGQDEDAAIAELETAISDGLGDNDEPPASQPAAPRMASPGEPETDTPGVIKGIGAAPGIATGPVFHFEHTELNIDNLEAHSGNGHMGLDEALIKAKEQLSAVQQQMSGKNLEAEAAIFDAHSELLDDPDLRACIQVHLAAGQSPARAWKMAIDEQAAVIARVDDPLLAARADDLRDVGRRVLCLMLGFDGRNHLPSRPVVVIARELSPSDTASFDPVNVLGFGITSGGPTSHIAILARALGLPAIVGLSEAALGLPEDTPVILNGSDGTLMANPAPDDQERAAQAQKRWLDNRRAAQNQAAQPAVTLDGHLIEVTANAGSPADAVEAMKMSADGIGLLRTEFLFLDRATAPSEDEQLNVYKTIAETMGDLPVIIRTLDIGGDKPLPYIQLKAEMNPFLGERGIRLCLNRTALFREQLRAILRAANSGNLRIMFPMISDISEVRQGCALIDEIRREVGAPQVQVGIMIEVPSAALLADKLAPEVDFFSIGTNDLTQYTLAIDRGNSALGSRHDGLHPAVLRLIAKTVDAAHHHGKRVDICGELGSDPAAVPILLGLGIDELSVSIPSVPTVKAQVRGLRIGELEPLAKQALECATAQEVRELVRTAITEPSVTA